MIVYSKQTVFSTPLVVATIFVSCWTSYCLFQFMHLQPDSEGYVNAIKLLLGQAAEADRLQRLNKPLALFFPALLHQYSTISIVNCLIIQQIAAYCVAAYVVFRSYALLMDSSYKGYLAMLAFLGCQPLAVYGMAALTDSLGWCYSCIGLYGLIRLFQKKPVQAYSLFMAGCFIGLGIMIKESVVMVGVWLFFSIAYQNCTWKQKINAYLWSGTGFVLVLGLGSFFVFQYSQKYFWDWWEFAHKSPPSFSYLSFFKQIYRCFDVFWIFILLGLVQFVRQTRSKNACVFFGACLCCCCLLPLVWPYFNDRILFLVGPIMVYWIVQGVTSFLHLAPIILLIGGCMNLATAYLIYQYQLSGLILLQLILYAVLLLSLDRFILKSPLK